MPAAVMTSVVRIPRVWIVANTGTGISFQSLEIDTDGHVYVSGMTASVDFPIVNGCQLIHGGGWDGFVSKLDNSLRRLMASTFLGGSADDETHDLTLVEDVNVVMVYVTGTTESQNFPTAGTPHDQLLNDGVLPGSDAFISRLSGDLGTLQASTFLGGTNVDRGHAIAASADESIYVAGLTQATDFPIPSLPFIPYQDNLRGFQDTFVAKLDKDLSTLSGSTYLGGTAPLLDYEDVTWCMCLDEDENVLVSGGTVCVDFPVVAGAYDTTLAGHDDCFVTRLSNDLQALMASTFVGGSNASPGERETDTPFAMSVMPNGDVLIGGNTMSLDFPTTLGAFDTFFVSPDDREGFISRLNGTLTSLVTSTFLGGRYPDAVLGIATPGNGNVYVTGGTWSDDFPTTLGAYSGGPAGSGDCFVSRFDLFTLGRAFCFGDPGSGTPCPCNNDNDGSVPGSGCANGAFASGAQLTGSGMASVSADTLVFTTTGLQPNNTGLYFQADNALNSGDGIVFGDGLRCAGGALIRLQIRYSNAAGSSSTTIALGAKGGVSPGDTKRYQCWYRDTSGSQPCGPGVNDFNLSNGYEITWLP